MEDCSNTQLMHKAKEEKEVFFRISLIPDFRHFSIKCSQIVHVAI